MTVLSPPQIAAPPRAPLKRLKDFPLKVWQPAADTCEYCGAEYRVRVTWVDKTGNFGDIEFASEHNPDCMRDMAGEIELESGGWEFAERTITLGGVEWTPLKTRANVGPCLKCGRLIVGIPLILFLDQGRLGELDFCFSCAEKLGILAQLLKGPKP